MKIWIERALAALRWGWEKTVLLAKAAWAWIVKTGNTIYDPPPVAYKRLFFVTFAIFIAGGMTFAFVNSWFYKPTANYVASLLSSDTYILPEEMEPLPPVTTPATPLPSVEVVCHDMSDTPQCEPVKTVEASKGAGSVEVVPPVSKSNDLTKLTAKPNKIRKFRKVRKHRPYQTYWGF